MGDEQSEDEQVPANRVERRLLERMARKGTNPTSKDGVRQGGGKGGRGPITTSLLARNRGGLERDLEAVREEMATRKRRGGS
jgi:hypothetical protein